MNLIGIILLVGMAIFATYMGYTIVRDLIKRRKEKNKEDDEV